jgi:mRNA interferase HigB
MFPIWELFYILQVRIIAKKTLREFWLIHNDCEQSLKSWYKEAFEATWA